MYNGIDPVTDGITAGAEERRQRGQDIAKVVRIDRAPDSNWLVPSMSGNGRYKVNTANGLFPTCTCPDHEQRGCKCKHIWAVEFSAQRETTRNADGSTTVTDTVTITAT